MKNVGKPIGKTGEIEYQAAFMLECWASHQQHMQTQAGETQ